MIKQKAGRTWSLILVSVLVLSLLQAAAVTVHADSVDFPVQVNMAGKVSVDEIRGVKTSSENGSVTGEDVSFGDYINLNLHVTDILNAYLAQYGGVVAAESIMGSPSVGEDGAVEVSDLSGQVQLIVDVPGGLSVSEAATYARSESSLIGLNLASVSGSRAVFDIYMRTGSGQDVYNLYNSDRDTNLIFSVYYEGTLPAGTAVSDICVTYSMGGSLTFVNNETGDSQTIRHSAVNNSFAIAGGSYGVSYSWTGAPDGLALPVNDTAYSAGSQVTVDSTYLPGYQVEGTLNGLDGVFTFSGWHDGSGNVVSVAQIPSGGGNLTLTGSWEFEGAANAEYHVVYRYVSGTEGKSLPDTLAAPVDENVYSEGDVIMASDPAGDRFEAEDGLWTSAGFDESVKTASPTEAPGGEIVFTKVWTFEEYVADVTEEGTPEAVTNPEESSVPEAAGEGEESVPETPEQAAASEETQAEMAEPEGTDSSAEAADFEEVESDAESVISEAEAAAPEDETTYAVKYAFQVDPDQTEPSELPDEVKQYLPKEESGKKSGDKVNPAELVDEEGNPVDHVDITDPLDKTKILGTWYFAGWDEYEITIEDQDVTFTGSWFYMENDRHPVLYKANFDEWEGPELIDEGPEEEDRKGYKAGKPVTVLKNEKETEGGIKEPFYIREGYQFDGWNTQADGKGTDYDPGDKTAMSEDGLTLYAQWKALRTVSYTYKPDGLPSEVTATIPTTVKVDGTEKPVEGLKVAEGSNLVPVDPSKKSVKIDDLTVWDFKGFSPASATVGDSDVVFTGTWEKRPTHNVSYVFEPSNLPDDVKKLLPDKVIVNGTEKTAPGKVLEGDDLKAVQPSQTTVKVSYSEAWEFKGFDAAEKTVGKEDVVFTGTWEKKPTYGVSYKFVPEDVPDEVKKLIPQKVNVDGSDVDAAGLKVVDETKLVPKDPSAVSVKTDTSTWWVFTGYTPASVIVGGSDVIFNGNWVKISYKFVSGTEGRGLPSPANNYLPTKVKVNGTEKDLDGLRLDPGSTLEPSDPGKKEITVQYADGSRATWEFKGYTPASSSSDNSNVTFTGTWEMKQVFHITYSGNGGSGSVTDNTEYKAGDSFTVLQNGFTKSGYSFVEWNTKADGTGDSYSPGQTYTMPTPGHDIVLYAVWAQYKVTYRFVSGTDGKILPSVVLKYLPVDNNTYADGATVYAQQLVDSTGAPKTKVKLASGGTWYWKGWDKGSATMTSEGVVFTGTWTFKIKYDLTYEMNGGGGAQIYDKDAPYLKDEVFQVFAGPTPPSGKYFKCWREVKEDGSLGQEFKPGHSYKMPQRDLVLRAEWTTKQSEEDTSGESGAGGGSGFISASDGTQNRYGDTTGVDGTFSNAEDVLPSENAKTGDERPIGLYIILLAAAAAAVVCLLFIRRRKK